MSLCGYEIFSEERRSADEEHKDKRKLIETAIRNTSPVTDGVLDCSLGCSPFTSLPAVIKQRVCVCVCACVRACVRAHARVFRDRTDCHGPLNTLLV